MEVVDFGGANLQEATLEGANLKHTNFTDAQLQNANFQGADLTQADFRMAMNLTQGQVDSAITDETTKLPGYLRSVEGQ